MSLRDCYWVATRKQDTYVILGYNGLREKKFLGNQTTQEFSIVHAGEKTNLGTLLRVDLSPEAILSALPLEQGDRVLLFGTAGRTNGKSPGP